jgi:hypothetical protein
VTESDLAVDLWPERRMALAREWNVLVEQARSLPGFEDFMSPPRLVSLLPAAGQGSVVVVNVSSYRCDALIIDSGGVQVVELNEVTDDIVVAHTEDYLDAIERFERYAQQAYMAKRRVLNGDTSEAALHGFSDAAQKFQDDRVAMEHTLSDTLKWLWDAIAEPVLTRLGFHDTPRGVESWPRIWWCPTGPLTLLPLHAAGYHDVDQTGAPQTVVDRVVSSYTPTLRALHEAVKERPTAPDNGKLLMVALPDTAGQPPLPNVAQEREVLFNRFGVDRVTVLEGEAATRDAIRAALALHPWAHFSCHGDQNLLDPSHGGLLVHDGVLTIEDVATGRHHGEFAFMSSCKTATGSVKLPDEAITLAAALHYTGFRHVIATLWSIYDDTAARVADDVYAQLTTGGRFAFDGAAHALHNAVHRLRELPGVRPSSWIAFTHTGP